MGVAKVKLTMAYALEVISPGIIILHLSAVDFICHFITESLSIE